jgi:SAM-dependent methyltransferase
MSPRRGVSCGSHSRGTARLSDPGTPVDSVADPDGESSSSRSAVEIDSGKNIEVNRYTFGDDRAALDRLRRVATAYEPVSRAFLVGHGPWDPQIALDLGCGPGFSTQLLDELFHPRTLVGIDSSGAFVESARARLAGARFETHDVTTNPLPGGPADLIYARLLLAHIADPLTVARGWGSQLRQGGRLLIEDLEDVIDPPGPLHEYEDVSAQIVRSGGGLMYAGAALAGLGGESRRVTVSGAAAAQIYLFNVRRWRETPDLPISDPRLRKLEADLVEIMRDDRGTHVSWVVRQLVVTA